MNVTKALTAKERLKMQVILICFIVQRYVFGLSEINWRKKYFHRKQSFNPKPVKNSQSYYNITIFILVNSLLRIEIANKKAGLIPIKKITL